EPLGKQRDRTGARRVLVAEPSARLPAAEQASELRLPRRGAGGELAHLLLVPARPAHLGGVRALARGGDHPPVDVEEIAIGVKAELGLDPRAALARHVLVPDRRPLHDVAVAVEHRKVLAYAHGHGGTPQSMSAPRPAGPQPRDG